jgi:hypothetical protein
VWEIMALSPDWVTEKFTGPNIVLLVLGQRTDVHREDWLSWIFLVLKFTETTVSLHSDTLNKIK